MAQITEDYVSFETAKLLKEKGFDEKCSRYWQYDKANDKDDVDGICLCCCDGALELNNSELDTFFEESLLNFGYSAPTLQMAIKWLREVHKLHIAILWDCGAYVGKNSFYYHIDRMDNYEDKGYNKIGFDSIEETIEAGIKYCLENLI